MSEQDEREAYNQAQYEEENARNESIAAAALEAAPPDSYIDEEDPAVSAPWEVRSLADADFALKRLGDLEREQAENEEVLAFAIAKLKARHEKLSARIQRGVDFFTGKLRMFAEANRATLLTGKQKSRKLLSGSIGWRAKPATLKVLDAEALLAWAQQQPVELEFVRVKEEPALATIQKHFKATGEVPAGAEHVPETDEFKVTTGEG